MDYESDNDRIDRIRIGRIEKLKRKVSGMSLSAFDVDDIHILYKLFDTVRFTEITMAEIMQITHRLKDLGMK